MLTPFVSDSFMDPLVYKEDATQLDTSLNIGQVVGKPNFLFDYTEELTNELQNQGYELNQDIFTFPYDWRKDIADIAGNELKQNIDDILANSSKKKVDIVAHSQGGLVIKRLLFDHPEYEQKIDKLIFVGTPHLGAAKAGKALLYGDNMNISFGPLGLDPQEVKKISQNMPSLYELLPSREYFNHTNGYIGQGELLNLDVNVYHVKTYNYEETEQFLKDKGLNINLIDQAESFHSSQYDNFDFTDSGIDAYNIVGCQDATITKVFQKQNGDYGLSYGPGDTTVPIFSASNIGGTLNLYALETNHGTMLTQNGTRQQIVNLIAGSSLSTEGVITPYASECKFNGQQVSVHSPVDLHIYDEDGNHTGPGLGGEIEFGIPGVQYNTIEHNKFAFLPSGHNYRISMNATDSGSFSFYSSIIEDSQIVNTAYYHEIQVNATSLAAMSLNEDNNQVISLDLEGDGMFDEGIDPSAILDGEASLDLITPITQVGLAGKQWKDGIYKSDVLVSLEATDEGSGVLETWYSLNGIDFEQYGEPFVLEKKGDYTVYYYSVDKAGNNEEIQELGVKIGKIDKKFQKCWKNNKCKKIIKIGKKVKLELKNIRKHVKENKKEIKEKIKDAIKNFKLKIKR